MIVRIKKVEHARQDDAPFTGALVSAKGCKQKCTGCFNRHLKKEPTIALLAEEVIGEVQSNPINEGIIFGGLEWSEQPLELLELAKLADEVGLQVMIYTGLELIEFYKTIGTAVYETQLGRKITEADLPVGFFEGFLSTLGSVALDFNTPSGYFLKCGRYDKTKKGEIVLFGVTLSSTNQTIFHIKGDKDEDKNQISEGDS